MKGIGEKVLGMFIVTEDEAPNVAPKPRPARAPVPEGAGFGAVYRAAGLPDEDCERLAKVVALVESLPQNAPFEVKRQIVGASLAAFGVAIDGVLAAGNGAVAALDAHVEDRKRCTDERVAEAEARIAKLAAEIDEARRAIDATLAKHADLARAAAAEKARVRGAVEFFSAKKNPS